MQPFTNNIKHDWKELLAGVITFLYNLTKEMPSFEQLLQAMVLGGAGWFGAFLLQSFVRYVSKKSKQNHA